MPTALAKVGGGDQSKKKKKKKSKKSNTKKDILSKQNSQNVTQNLGGGSVKGNQNIPISFDINTSAVDRKAQTGEEFLSDAQKQNLLVSVQKHQTFGGNNLQQMQNQMVIGNSINMS